MIEMGVNSKWIIVSMVLLLTTLFLMFPSVMGTRTFPLAIIEGNSMYPNLQNGDLVVFHAVSSKSVKNGSIIVFIQGQTGISLLDSLIRPVVIHRVKDIILQYDGVANYRTKGDNNQEGDPELVQDSQILGSPVLVIPKVGLLFLFLRSSEGMIAVVGFITLLYLGSYESKIKGNKERSGFLGKLAQLALNKEISDEMFRKLEVGVQYVDDLNLHELKENGVRDLIQWIREGGLEDKWEIESVECPTCQLKAIIIKTRAGLSFMVCEGCDSKLDKNVKDPLDILLVPESNELL